SSRRRARLRMPSPQAYMDVLVAGAERTSPGRGSAGGRGWSHDRSRVVRATPRSRSVQVHADRVIPAVDVQDLARDPRGEVRAQERGGVADILGGDVAS